MPYKLPMISIPLPLLKSTYETKCGVCAPRNKYIEGIPSIFMWLPRFIGEPILRRILEPALAKMNANEIVRVKCELRTLSEVKIVFTAFFPFIP